MAWLTPLAQFMCVYYSHVLKDRELLAQVIAHVGHVHTLSIAHHPYLHSASCSSINKTSVIKSGILREC